MDIKIYAPKYLYEKGDEAEKQENALWPMPGKETTDDRMFIICDARGKDGCGDVVSQAMCAALATWFKENVAEGEPVDGEQLKQAIEEIYKDVEEQYADREKKIYLSMSLLYLHRDGTTVAHIGNCRIYHARAKKNKPILRWFKKNNEKLYESIDQSEIRLGRTDGINVEVEHITGIQPNDVFAMCNAGMLDVDEDAQDSFIYCIMSHRIGVMSPKNADLEYFKREIAHVLCMHNHSAWVIRVKSV